MMYYYGIMRDSALLLYYVYIGKVHSHGVVSIIMDNNIVLQFGCISLKKVNML